MKVYLMVRMKSNIKQKGANLTDYSEIIKRAVQIAKENLIVGIPIEPEIQALVEEMVIVGADEYETSVTVGKLTEALGIFPKYCVEAGDYYRKTERRLRLNQKAAGGCKTVDNKPVESLTNDKLFEKIKSRG